MVEALHPSGSQAMISQLLSPDQVVLDLKGDFSSALRRLAAVACPGKDMGPALDDLILAADDSVMLAGEGISLPHLRVAGLDQPRISLGLSRKGISHRGKRFSLILFLATPEQDSAGHLKLLQRLKALLPQLRNDLLKAKTAAKVVAVLAAGEETSVRPTFFNLTQDQVAVELRTDPVSGLSSAQAKSRLSLHGPNQIRRVAGTPEIIKLLRNFFSFFAILIWVAALLCFVPGVDMPQLGVAILLVVVINGFFSFLQEQRSDRAVEALQRLCAQQCRVLRDGRTVQIDAALLVPGDVLLLEEGDIVAADARLIDAVQVEVDNSSLTGESESAKRYKSDNPILLPGKFLWIELPNVVFAGSVLVSGTARAIVFGTGMNTEIGKIAGLTQAIKGEESPLQKQLRATVLSITLLAGGLGLVFLFLGWLVAGLTFVQAFVFFIGIFVANVPEGLLPTVTLSLAMGVTRMARRNAIVKNISSVETLGCTTVICSDKTGTLTQNLVMVTHLWTDGDLYTVGGEGYRPEGAFQRNGQTVNKAQLTENPATARLLECALTCNNAHLEKSRGQWRIVGDPTEGALVVMARKAGLHGTHQRLHVNPFESVRKRMSVVVRGAGAAERLLYVKGALVETLGLCDRILREGLIRPISESDRSQVMTASDDLARQGLRILALAYRDDLEDSGDWGVDRAEQKLIFIGFTASSDPVRPDVPEAIESCHRAGIRLMMITGDYPLTAECIGRQAGIGQLNPNQRLAVMDGAEVMSMDDDRLKAVLSTGETIFARVAPEEKLRIVSLLKQLGEIVAVTGDGVNDGPALRCADIGIAMGRRGTDVAKEAARMILGDDNFSTIVAAIEEGRAIFENIKRFVAYVFNSNPQELYPYIFWMLFPEMPLTMTVMGVLAVDVGTDLIPAMGLGIERPEKGLMDRPPRAKTEKLLSMGFILRAYFIQGTILALSCYATYYFCGWYMGWWAPPDALSSMPASPAGLKMDLATPAYLMSLTAYFFPTVTTQIANVLCKRSWKTSLFSKDFIDPQHRREILDHIGTWRPWSNDRVNQSQPAPPGPGLPPSTGSLWWQWLAFPLRVLRRLLTRLGRRLEKPLIRPAAAAMSRTLERHPVTLNFVSNPLIDIGIVFELGFCVLLFYTDLARIYYFAPVPWPVYLFAFTGTVVLTAFEEAKKFLRRRSHRLEFLG
ncbi:MAG: HAD-IC family P-type ATPase [Desulfobacterales bacterium]|jgi:magnesium-transporting ATPase (P-type)|nr:HAD-IC family P-type ATPase [Desulfobacterales bacterium]MDD3080608.1 HAD-IC family P-type ATPase [Desulfobacterales bacterium]MDD3949613.1 HAD-IC family P-type ATPase [Desulfobacterales bacterium]MDY0376948.1 HAD-IC family P-type ATPase [Desulfobacterales bacterium]